MTNDGAARIRCGCKKGNLDSRRKTGICTYDKVRCLKVFNNLLLKRRHGGLFVLVAIKNRECKTLIIEYLKQYSKANRKEINKLLWDKLPDSLSDDQKKHKVRNLLAALKNKNIIEKDGEMSGIKTDDNRWNIKGHSHRVVRIGNEELLAIDQMLLLKKR